MTPPIAQASTAVTVKPSNPVSLAQSTAQKTSTTPLPTRPSVIGAVNPPVHIFLNPIVATSAVPDQKSATIHAINLVSGALGGLVESGPRSVIESTKIKGQLYNLNPVAAANNIFKESGFKGFFPLIKNTATVRSVQRGGIFALANSDLDKFLKTGLAFAHELVVTSANQFFTTHALAGNASVKQTPFKHMVNQVKTHGIVALITPYSAVRNLSWLLAYVELRERFSDKLQTNPVATNVGITAFSTLVSHIFDPSAVFHTKNPEIPTWRVPLELFKQQGLVGLLGRGATSRLFAVGIIGAGLYSTSADLIKKCLSNTN